MTSDARTPRSRPGLRAVAVIAAFTFGCATVRVPTSAIGATVPVHGGAAEPQVELWLESGGEVSPQEAADATAATRAALGGALATRRVSEGEQLLVVRAQGVSRTASRRADQRAAVAGIVVGAVVIVAAVVVILVSGKGGGHGGGGGKVGKLGKAGTVKVRPAPPPVASAPVPVPRPAPVPGRGVRPPPLPRSSARAAVGISADVHVSFPVPPDGPPPASTRYLGRTLVEPAADAAADGALTLPPPQPLDVERRGFFAKDLLRLELTLVDRATGTPLWVKTVEGEIDPRNPEAVRALLDAALDEPSGWIPAARTAA